MGSEVSTTKKIINDPVYGFVSIQHTLLFKLIEHPWFQRLRRIRQLGLGHLVYPGATHTRFHHALGALHLMGQAIDSIRSKGHLISEEEAIAVQIAILLHDIGHSPYSHALEHSLIEESVHEKISLLFMQKLNEEFEGRLELAISIFTGTYPKKFLHGLVSSQLDMDRMDYLNRDSFYTGVLEGKIGTPRIIRMLDVCGDELVVEEKGLYSIEKFLIARRLMYWQVYLHKTVLAAEHMLVNTLRRAKELFQIGERLFCSPELTFFLQQKVFFTDPAWLDHYALLDDADILSAVKAWMKSPDPVLSRLSEGIINRRMYKVKMQREPFPAEEVSCLESAFLQKTGLDANVLSYYTFQGRVSNEAYDRREKPIRILMKDGSLHSLHEVSDQFETPVESSTVNRFFLAALPELMS